MIEKIRKYIAENHLASHQSTLIVGLSGGADSMALLEVLLTLEYRCVAAHCNFHLRGAESDNDVFFVKEWCDTKNIEFVSIDFDTRKHAAEKKISVEMAARELRYNWFEILRHDYKADAIAVAHHKDDSVETVLLNLIRGTGISGLSGISAKNNRIIRPMLCVTRKDIESFLEEKKIPFRTDSTNEMDVYKRNYIRLNILPAMEKLNPSVKEAIHRTSQNIAGVEKIYRASVNKIINEVRENNRIDIKKLKQTESPSTVLFEILFDLGFNPLVIEDICKNIDAESGKQFFSSTHRLIKDRDFLLIDEISNTADNNPVYIIYRDERFITEPIAMEIVFIDNNPVEMVMQKSTLYADADKLSFPLVLRKWKTGDWFIPFGMKGRKKLSDYFNDHKFSLIDKEKTWILVSGEEVVWIVGHRNDNRFRVTQRTKRILKIELK